MGETEDLDTKLRKAFHELALKTGQTNEQLEEVHQSHTIMEQNIKVAEIVTKEVKKLPEDKTVFHSIGRIFVQRNHDEEIADQQKDIDSFKKRIDDLQKQKEYLKTSLSEAQKNLRELVQQTRAEKA